MITKMRRWYFGHIRHQVFTIIAVMVLIVSVALGVISWAATEIAADSFINKRVSLKQQQWVQASLQRGAPISINQPYLTLYDVSDADKPSYLNRTDNEGIKEFSEYDAHVFTFLSPFEKKKLHLVYLPNLDPEMVDYGQGVVAYVCYMMILVFIVGLVSANLISKHFTAPILSLIEQVERSSGDNIQMPGTNRRDEIGELHRAFYQSFSRIQAFLHREKQFTRFSSHELRTPVHVIGGSVQLLEMCENDKKRLEIIKRISGANRDMEQLINTFLFIGREQKNRQPEVRLSDTLRDCIEEHKYLLSDRDVNIECHSSSDEMVKMYFAKVIVANLVRNAFNYAKSKVVVTLSARRLLIENDITSDAEAGFGHGKHIIDEICKVEKWHYYASIKPYKALVVIYF